MPATTCAGCGAALDARDLSRCAACGASVSGAAPADAEELAALRADTVGHYDIMGELGRGGMATVYLAHDIALGRKVAIKVMSPALAAGDGVERFTREARTAAALSHPNIIPIYAVRHTDRLLYFVMKYVSGRPLDTIVRELGPLPIPMVQAILGQVASAFGYAHRHGVVHRDIKPGNMLIDDEGWVAVTDFGIAKVAESEQLTTTGLAVGTPAYMSPEQVTAGPVSGASDQYSLGVVAYEMLTGKPPFQGGGAMAMMYAHVHQPLPPIERADCPDALRDAVMRMLAKEPADRWPSVEDAVGAIGAAPAALDDSTRSQLIALARTGAEEQLAGVARTPRSPIPLVRTPAPRATTPAPAGAAAGAPPVRGVSRRASPISVVLAVSGVAIGIGSLWVVAHGRPARGGVTAAPARVARPATTGAAAPGDSLSGLAAPSSMPAGGAVPASEASSTSAQSAPPPMLASPLRPAKIEPRQSNVRAKRASRPTDRDEAHGATAVGAQPTSPPLSPAAAPTAPVTSAPAPPAARDVQSISGAMALLGIRAPAVQAAPENPDLRAVESAIRSYAAALEAGNAADARRIFPAMSDAQHAHYANLFASGGRVRTKWKVSDVVVTGDSATARVRGRTRAAPATGTATEERLDLRAVLERSSGVWRLRTFGAPELR